jgi:hypothetical protein
MAYPKRLVVDEIRSLGFASILAAYSAVGGALLEPCRIFCITNTTDQNIFISLDGVANNFIIPTNSFKLIDVTANKVRDDGFFVAEGSFFYVKRVSAAPTLGSVYIEIIHG